MRVSVARKGLRILQVALACCLATGCATTSDTGVGSVGGLFSAPSGPSREISLFMASTRRKSAEPIEEASYSLQTVSVPAGHKPGVIEGPRFGAPDPDSHFVVVRRSALSSEEFRTEIASHISGRVGNSRDVLVYIHGFNTTLEEARLRLAQIVADGGFTGVPILFTWPTKGALLAYGSDKESATASRDALVKLLNDLSETPGVGRVQILAHSMGSWLTMEALRETALSGRRDLNGKLGSVMLAAPDIDLGVFRTQISKLDPSHFSIFVSRDDRALSMSRRIAGDRERLGAMNPDDPQDAATIKAMGVRVYDLSALSTGWIGHSTYADAPDAVKQIGATLTRKRNDADADTQAVLDARGAKTPDEEKGVSAPPAADKIIAQPLAPPSTR